MPKLCKLERRGAEGWIWKCEGEQILGYIISEVPFSSWRGACPPLGCRTFGRQEHGKSLQVVRLVPLIVVHHEPVVPWRSRAGRELGEALWWSLTPLWDLWLGATAVLELPRAENKRFPQRQSPAEAINLSADTGSPKIHEETRGLRRFLTKILLCG